jgi:hypothetical protein
MFNFFAIAFVLNLKMMNNYEEDLLIVLARQPISYHPLAKAILSVYRAIIQELG